MTSATILALDASSTTIGYCFYDGTVIASGEIRLQSDHIAERCRLAYAQFNGLLQLYPLPDVVAIESPVARYAGAVIPQARVSGALMVAATLVGLMVIEIEPQKAKYALTGKGNAGKPEMQEVAWRAFGIRGEHAADALGIALAAYNLVSIEIAS